MTLQDGSEISASVLVPTVEAAVVLKAYAWHDRGAQTPKDIIDVSNLLHVLDEHGAEAVGGWTLDQPGIIGARSDAARYLHDLAAKVANRRTAPAVVDSRKLAVLIRRHVHKP